MLTIISNSMRLAAGIHLEEKNNREAKYRHPSTRASHKKSIAGKVAELAKKLR